MICSQEARYKVTDESQSREAELVQQIGKLQMKLEKELANGHKPRRCRSAALKPRSGLHVTPLFAVHETKPTNHDHPNPNPNQSTDTTRTACHGCRPADPPGRAGLHEAVQ